MPSDYGNEMSPLHLLPSAGCGSLGVHQNNKSMYLSHLVQIENRNVTSVPLKSTESFIFQPEVFCLCTREGASHYLCMSMGMGVVLVESVRRLWMLQIAERYLNSFSMAADFTTWGSSIHPFSRHCTADPSFEQALPCDHLNCSCWENRLRDRCPVMGPQEQPCEVGFYSALRVS